MIVRRFEHRSIGVLGRLLVLWVAMAAGWQMVWAQAQEITNVVLKGEAANAAGKEIGLYGYSDMLSQQAVRLDETRVGEDGRFELRCYANYPRLVYVEVENYSQSFYVEPGRDYTMYLPEFDWSIDETHNVFLDPVVLPLRFLDLPSDELNLQIGDFEAVVDSFLLANRVFFDPKFKPQKRYFDTLMACLAMRGYRLKPYGAEGETFADRYMHYQLASIALATGARSRRQLVGKYVEGQPVRYYDEQYMRLFFDLYAGRIARGMKRVPMRRLQAWVHAGDIATYLDSIGLDPLLRNEQVRELAALQALKESYYDRDYDSPSALRMIELLGQASKFEEHRVLAERLAQALTEREPGGETPRLVLPDKERHMVSLDSMKGKWVYLNFVRVGDPNCIAELETMAHFCDSLYERYPNVRFVSISCDREFQKMYLFLTGSKRGRRYGWTWLHFDGDYRLLEHFGVVSYPTFVMINPEGRWHYTVTPPPASGILLHGPWDVREEQGSGFKAPFINR
ncbi:MAG: TlpA family protein disulfide reductase [Bacteroidales bacterium]|nr:TlpA family protein disulfide reductase [Bacteroidales bacterium]